MVTKEQEIATMQTEIRYLRKQLAGRDALLRRSLLTLRQHNAMLHEEARRVLDGTVEPEPRY
jgi:hypothetical protein